MAKLSWTDGAAATVAIGARGASLTRIVSARVDLTDDRSFLDERHRDLVETLPNLSGDPDHAPAQGWIQAGTGAGSCELHVLLRSLPPGVDLVLGRCAVELLSAAASSSRR